MDLSEWKELVNSPKVHILKEAKKFKSYKDWKSSILKTQSYGFKYFLKKYSITVSEIKEIFEYRKCRRCETGYANKALIGNRSYYCKKCANLINKKDYERRKKENKVQSTKYNKEKRKLLVKEFLKTSEFEELKNFVKQWGSSKTSKEMIAEFEKLYPNIKIYLLKSAVGVVKKKYNIRKLNKWETMSTEEKREIYRKKRKEYADKNPEVVRRINRNAQKRHLENPINKISNNLRGRINGVLKEKKFPKTKQLKEILGCDWETLEAWLSTEFTNGMTMDNYGVEWTLQHIVPLTHCENTKEVNLLNFYKNLKPMTLEENLSLNDNLLWHDLNEWHFENDLVGGIIDRIVEKDKVLDYENKAQRYMGNGDIKPTKKSFSHSDWRTYQNTKRIVINNTKEILKDVFTPTILENLKNQLEVGKHS